MILMKYLLNKFALALSISGLLMLSACEIDTVVDPNNPSLGGVLSDASKAELQALVTGLEARHRGYVTNATELFGCFGREVYAYFGSDPRFKSEWLGLAITETYPDFFSSGGTYVEPYLAVKQANILIASATASTQISTEEESAYLGLAKTIKGYQLLWPLMQQYQNGIRVDVEDPLNPGPTLPFNEALAAIRAILDEGFSDLDKAGSSLPYTLSAGFTGFKTPAGLQQINRAIAARAALYASDWQGAINALSGSFFNQAAASEADLNVGPAHVWGESPDLNNPLYYPFDRNTRTILIVHPAMIEDALPGDLRVTRKFARRVSNLVIDAAIVDAATGTPIPGEWQDARWATNVAPIPFIRNEELLLIYAEAQARLSQPGNAVNAINTIRNIWGVGNYTGATDTESLIDEILFQRRYSLWAEMGHRWVDLRRTNRLNTTYVDTRDGGNIFTQVARRSSEIAWDER
jgi:hypothetical protein